ncbi:SIS domain-containing protein [Amylibacter sp.]|nr:SIS domain-containing protein [Amylibacter sp.]
MSLFEKDPGVNNSFPTNESGAFDSAKYLTDLATEIVGLPQPLIDQVSSVLAGAINNGKQVFFCGNGGSFAIAEHMVCDYAKGMKRFYSNGVLAINIGSNHPLNSALTNDFGHENAFMAELQMYSHEGDVLVAISSSGNSQNILNCIHYAKKHNIFSVGLSGFGGGLLANLADIAFVSNQNNYPAVEASHQIFLDCVAFKLWK